MKRIQRAFDFFRRQIYEFVVTPTIRENVILKIDLADNICKIHGACKKGLQLSIGPHEDQVCMRTKLLKWPSF